MDGYILSHIDKQVRFELKQIPSAHNIDIKTAELWFRPNPIALYHTRFRHNLTALALWIQYYNHNRHSRFPGGSRRLLPGIPLPKNVFSKYRN